MNMLIVNNEKLLASLIEVCEAIGEVRTARTASQVLGQQRGSIRAEVARRLKEGEEATKQLAEATPFLAERVEQLKEQLTAMSLRENELRIVLTQFCEAAHGAPPLTIAFDAYQRRHKTGPYANGTPST